MLFDLASYKIQNISFISLEMILWNVDFLTLLFSLTTPDTEEKILTESLSIEHFEN